MMLNYIVKNSLTVLPHNRFGPKTFVTTNVPFGITLIFYTMSTSVSPAFGVVKVVHTIFTIVRSRHFGIAQIFYTIFFLFGVANVSVTHASP